MVVGFVGEAPAVGVVPVGVEAQRRRGDEDGFEVEAAVADVED